MLFSVEQAFVGRDEKRAPLKTPAWEAMLYLANRGFHAKKYRKKERNQREIPN